MINIWRVFNIPFAPFDTIADAITQGDRNICKTNDQYPVRGECFANPMSKMYRIHELLKISFLLILIPVANHCE